MSAGAFGLGEAVLVLSTDQSKYNQQLDAAERRAESFVQSAGQTIQALGSAMQDAGSTLTTRVTTPILAIGGAAATAAIGFESAFAGVRKTVDATEEEFAALERGIREMSKQLPASATEIAGVAEAAGQLGIKTENILDFTRVMIDLGEATNLSGVEAATTLARLANITQMSQTDFDRLGSTIVALGNNLATTEAEIAEMALRLAGAGAQVGLSEAQILGFAGALSSVGIEAEAGGSAVSRVMIEIANAVANGSEKLDQFADVAGMTTEEFKTAFEQDAAGAIITFIEGLGRMSAEGENVFQVLDDMGLSEIRVRDALLRAAGAGDLFRESIKLGTEAWEENTALANEAEQRYATTASQLAMLRNQATDVAISLGQALLPIIREHLIPAAEQFVGMLQRLVDAFTSLDPRTQKIILAILGLAAAIGPALVVLGKVLVVVGALVSPLGLAVAAIAALGIAIKTNLWGIGDTFRGFAEGVMAVVDAFREGGLRGALDEILDRLPDLVDGLGNLASNIGSGLLSALTGVDWTGLASAVLDGLLAGLEAVGDAAGRILGWLAGALGSVDWTGLGMTLVDGLLSGLGAAADAGGRILGWLGGVLASVDWSGLGRTLVDGIVTAATAVGDFGQRIVGWMQTQLAGADWSGMGQAIKGGLDTALQSISDLGSSGPVQSLVAMLSERLGPAFQQIADIVGPRVTPTINALRESFGQVAEVISARIGPLADQFRETMAALGPVLTVLAGIVGGVLLAAFNALGNFLAAVLPPAINLVLAAFEAILVVIETVAKTVTNLVNLVVALFRGDWAAAWKSAKALVVDLAGGIIEVIAGLGPAILGLIEGLIDGIIGFFRGLYQTIVGNSIIPDMVTEIIDWFSRLPGEILGILGGFVADAIAHFVNLAAEAIGKAQELYNEVTSRISEMVTAALSSFANLAAGAIAKAGELVSNVLEKLTELITEGPAKVADMAGALADEFGRVASEAFSWGANIVQGVIDGINSLKDRALGAISDLAQGLIDAGKGVLGIFSPSREFIVLGRMVAEGLALGIEHRAEAAIVSAQQMAQAIIDGVQDDLERLPGLVGRINNDVILAIDKMRADLEGQLVLAQIVGDDEEVERIMARLEAISATIETWAAETGQTVTEVYADAFMGQKAQELWEQKLADLGKLLDGTLQQELEDRIRDLEAQLAFAIAAGAPEAIIEGLRDAIADAQDDLAEITADMAAAAAAGLASDASLAAWQKAADEATAIFNGTALKRVQQGIEEVNAKIAFMVAKGAPQKVIDALLVERDRLEAELALILEDLGIAAAEGLLSEDVLFQYEIATREWQDIIIERLRDTQAAMPREGAMLVDMLIEGIESGQLALEDVTARFPNLIVPPVEDATAAVIALLKDLGGAYEDAAKKAEESAKRQEEAANKAKQSSGSTAKDGAEGGSGGGGSSGGSAPVGESGAGSKGGTSGGAVPVFSGPPDRMFTGSDIPKFGPELWFRRTLADGSHILYRISQTAPLENILRFLATANRLGIQSVSGDHGRFGSGPRSPGGWAQSVINSAAAPGMERVRELTALAEELGLALKGARQITSGTVTAFAKGGLVTRPALGLVGEAGPEGVIPLTGRGARLVAEALVREMAGVLSNGVQAMRHLAALPGLSTPTLPRIRGILPGSAFGLDLADDDLSLAGGAARIVNVTVNAPDTRPSTITNAVELASIHLADELDLEG